MRSTRISAPMPAGWNTPDSVAGIARLAADPEKLDEMAPAAPRQGILDTTDRLADPVIRVAGIAIRA
jgi:hypothetical protein